MFLPVTMEIPGQNLKQKYWIIKAWFPPDDKSRFYRQIGDKSKVITKMEIVAKFQGDSKLSYYEIKMK